MKLALVRQKYTPFGGAERFVERALGTLAAQGTEVTLLCREWSGGGAGAFPIDICDPAYAKIMGRKGRDASFAHAVQAIIAQHRFDLVQSHERIPGCHVFRAGDGVHATWLELRGRAQNAAQRFATRIHPWHRYVLDAEAAMFRHPDLRAVICNSRMVRDDIRQRFGVAEDRLHLIHNGVDAEHFHPGLCEEHRAELRAQWHIPATAPLLLFVGSGFERKGVATLLDALAVMGRRDVHLLVVGKDKRQPVFARQAARLGLAHRVHFAGPQPDVRPFYGAADLFCLPTLYDPFPNAALEALACGLPVVTTTTCGAAELIEPGVNGGLCEALDVSALAQQLAALVEPTVEQRAAARASVKMLTPENAAERLLGLYSSLLSRRPPL